MDKIDELLNRGVANVIPSRKELEKLLRNGKKLRVYQGFDPTSPELHIGHMLGLRKLRQWQDLGHEVIFLIGDFTGMIGDPTGKDKTRVPLTHQQVLENAKTYKEQASKILRFTGNNPVIIKYNSEWLAKMSAVELARLTSYLSIQQVIERDMFQKRLKNNMDIAISEFLYPFMQGYDSVAMDVDVEIGGTDQLFNMMTGRDLMHKIKRKNKFVMTIPLLTDSQERKIGKTEGNVIALTDHPKDLYGKIMAIGDNIVVKGFEYLTDLPLDEIKNVEKEVIKDPMGAKKKLAFAIVEELHSKQDAENAADNFKKTVQEKELPSEIENLEVKGNIADALIELGLSKAEAKRLVEQNGITLDNKKVVNIDAKIKNGQILKIGKRKIVRISS